MCSTGWWLGKNPSEKWSSSIGMIIETQLIWENVKNGNQTTNQLWSLIYFDWLIATFWLMATQYFWENVKNGNQTTNQINVG